MLEIIAYLLAAILVVLGAQVFQTAYVTDRKFIDGAVLFGLTVFIAAVAVAGFLAFATLTQAALFRGTP